ncbi:response regulator [Thalassotalea fusca]
MAKKEVSFLLVEDNEVDIMDVQRSFRKAKVANPIHVARDGLEALELLRSGKIPSPYIVLMDLNMPRMDGIECIKEIRNDDALRRSVIFVLTTSAADEDKFKAYDFNIAGYIVKTESGEAFTDAITMLDSYWRVVELPC